MMMLKWIKTSLIWSGIVLSFSCYSQELPLGALPMQFNGSFAGEAGGPRISSNIGFQTGNLGFGSSGYMRRFYSLHTSYDQFIPALRSGIGITAGLADAKSSFSRQYARTIAMAIAPKFSIKGKYTLSPSLELYYNSLSASFQPWPDSVYRSAEITNYGARAGFLFNTDKYYISYAVYLIDQLNSESNYFNPSGYQRFSDRSGRFTSYLQLGYTFQKSSESNFSFTPQLTFLIGQRKFFFNNDNIYGIVAYNFNFRYKKFIWGLNNEGLHIGWQTKKLKLMLSNNLGISNSNSAYTANLSFRYIFK